MRPSISAAPCSWPSGSGGPRGLAASGRAGPAAPAAAAPPSMPLCITTAHAQAGSAAHSQHQLGCCMTQCVAAPQHTADVAGHPKLATQATPNSATFRLHTMCWPAGSLTCKKQPAWVLLPKPTTQACNICDPAFLQRSEASISPSAHLQWAAWWHTTLPIAPCLQGLTPWQPPKVLVHALLCHVARLGHEGLW